MTRKIVLNNGLSYIVLSEHILNGEKYLYLLKESENLENQFVKCVDDKYVEFVEDVEIIKELSLLVCDKVVDFVEKL